MIKIAGLLLLSLGTAYATIAPVQKAFTSNCSGTTCVVAVSSTGAPKHFLVGAVAWFSGTAHTISSVVGAGTWTVEPGCHILAGLHGLACAYNLNSTAGTTGFIFTLNSTEPVWTAEVREYSYTGSSMAFDTAAATGSSSFMLMCTMGTVFPTGTNDVLYGGTVTGVNVVSVAAPYGNYENDTVEFQSAWADHLNTTSGAGAVWTYTPANDVCNMFSLALQEIGGSACNSRLPLMGTGC